MANAPRTCPRLHIAELLSAMLFFHSRFVSLDVTLRFIAQRING